MNQQEERKAYLDTLLKSSARKKIVVAGPGTGKTHTFREILKLKRGGRNLVLTFIRKLVDDMNKELGDIAEVKTFHQFCKRVLHELYGGFEIVPYLTKIIDDDTSCLNYQHHDFDSKFQLLDETGNEIDFYIRRGDYYGVVSFDDSVFRLYKLLLEDLSVLEEYDQILIDEFQDFNPLEVAFLKEISKKGPILIAGDDDQAVYSGRNSSSRHLREHYHSGEYSIYELPFCSRCPKVIVDAVNVFIKNVQAAGGLSGRLERRFEPYLLGKEYENQRYPKMIKARLTTVKVIPSYVSQEIKKIPPEDIADSHNADNPYPTVLILGQKQYLTEIEKSLKFEFANVKYSFSPDPEIDPVNVYNFFVSNPESNFSWRVLLGLYFENPYKKRVIKESMKGEPLVKIVNKRFVHIQKRILDILSAVRKEKTLNEEDKKFLRKHLGKHFEAVVNDFLGTNTPEDIAIDKTQPAILLTSFEGCKGLSAGHVFIVGANNGSIPKIKNGTIDDVECSKFIVGLTRTRKCCYIISNRWLVSPKDKKGKWVPEFEESDFLSLIPKELFDDKGLLKASDFK